MNEPILSIAIFGAALALGYFTQEALRTSVLPRLNKLLMPVLQRLMPVLRMEPWLYEPIRFEEIPGKQQRYFESHTPGFLARRFTHLGDFVLRRDPEPSCVRLFLSEDGWTIGELNCYLGDRCIGCVSVLMDGFYIESANTHIPQPPPAEHGLRFCSLNTDDAGELAEYHAACVAQAAAERGAQVAPLAPDDVRAALNYGRELSLRSLVQQGVLSELPEFLRTLQPAAASLDSQGVN